MVNVSIIIPTFNESRGIQRCLAQFLPHDTDIEVIVVDGQSTDNTPSLIKTSPLPVKLINATHRGRAHQMNEGAQHAQGEWLMFLHADTLLPPEWKAEVLKAQSTAFQGGCFRVSHTVDHKLPWWAHFPDLRSWYTRYPYGDQAIFIRRDAFLKLHGYRPISLMEDYDFSRRFVNTFGSFYRSSLKVRPSLRRFQSNLIKYAIIMMFFPMLFRLGVNPDRLAKWYTAIR